MTLGEIARITGGSLGDTACPDDVVTAPVEFDSRLVRPGGLFLALPGEHVDGHDYVAAALASGAVAALATKAVRAPHVLVADGYQALAALAGAALRRLPEVTVVGVTGSSGKTSTKDLIAQLLERLGPTVAPPGSFNNELGFPYTVLLATERTQFLVLEASARGLGHIRYLAEIAPPRIGVVLNVGSAHLGEFGSRAVIARAKGELVEALPDDGVAILNADDPLVAAMRERTTARVVTFGTGPDAAVRAEEIAIDDMGRAGFALRAGGARARVALRLTGAHHVGNALAAAAVALECGLSLPDTADALSAATARSHWRMEVTERADGVVVINDAYNANPESMRAALTALAQLGGRRGGRTFAVLGAMGELGPDEIAEHEGVGRLIASLGVDRLVAVGELARPYLRGAAGADGAAAPLAATGAAAAPENDSWRCAGAWAPDADAAADLLAGELRGGDVVLVKASRAIGLERVALALAGTGPRHDDPRGSDPDQSGPRWVGLRTGMTE